MTQHSRQHQWSLGHCKTYSQPHHLLLHLQLLVLVLVLGNRAEASSTHCWLYLSTCCYRCHCQPWHFACADCTAVSLLPQFHDAAPSGAQSNAWHPHDHCCCCHDRLQTHLLSPPPPPFERCSCESAASTRHGLPAAADLYQSCGLCPLLLP